MVTIVSKPGQSQGLLYKQPCNSLSHTFPPIAFRRRHAQTVTDLPVICHSDQKLSKSQRASKSYQWFESHGNFTEGVDFAYWWSFSIGGSAIYEATSSSFPLY